jgi:electron transport complex protein RnfG
MAWRLTLFGVITSIFVGIIYVSTAPAIKAARESARLNALHDLAEPLLSDAHIGHAVLTALPGSYPSSLISPLLVTPIQANSRTEGVIIPVSTDQGYNGPIKMLLALDRNQKIAGFRVIEHRETPGLGDKIDADKTNWILQFDGMSYASITPELWAITKDGGQFDAFTGATITPRAVINALAETLRYLDEYPNALGIVP